MHNSGKFVCLRQKLVYTHVWKNILKSISSRRQFFPLDWKQFHFMHHEIYFITFCVFKIIFLWYLNRIFVRLSENLTIDCLRNWMFIYKQYDLFEMGKNILKIIIILEHDAINMDFLFLNWIGQVMSKEMDFEAQRFLIWFP